MTESMNPKEELVLECLRNMGGQFAAREIAEAARIGQRYLPPGDPLRRWKVNGRAVGQALRTLHAKGLVKQIAPVQPSKWEVT